MGPIFSPLPVPDAWIDEQLELLRGRAEILVNMARVARGDPCGQLARDAARIVAPVLFVHGGADRLVAASYPRALHRILQQRTRSEFHVLERCGHMLQLSHATEIRGLLLAWLDRVRPEDAPRFNAE
jgi:pimeloyl-ACP methyl ester carboxylesterase